MEQNSKIDTLVFYNQYHFVKYILNETKLYLFFKLK